MCSLFKIFYIISILEKQQLTNFPPQQPNFAIFYSCSRNVRNGWCAPSRKPETNMRWWSRNRKWRKKRLVLNFAFISWKKIVDKISYFSLIQFCLRYHSSLIWSSQRKHLRIWAHICQNQMKFKKIFLFNCVICNFQISDLGGLKAFFILPLVRFFSFHHFKT